MAAMFLSGGAFAVHESSRPPGVLLEDLTWLEAEDKLSVDTVVVIALGAAAKEHGPHLRLDNDFVMAEYLKGRVIAAADVVAAPTINYHYYPAFVDYPGSTHLRSETATELVNDIVHSLANYGPRRFYIINTGVSTLRPLKASAESLRTEGILLEFTNILTVAAEVEKEIQAQQRGTHADELETSMMLYIAPDRVDMSKAVKEDPPWQEGGFTRDPEARGTYSATGVWGDATLATRDKGERIVEQTVRGILEDIERLRTAPLP
jgi:creatinine amidohydrolase